MALYLRGDVWWFEVRTPTQRVRRSTGFHKAERAQAQAVFDAARLTMRTRPPRDAAKVILDAIYSRAQAEPSGLPVSSVWSVYEEWARGKGKVLSAKEVRDRRSVMRAFEAFAVEHRAATVDRVDVALARAFVAQLGGANKTQRNKATALATIWEAVGQMRPGVHNPWRAACPEDDGSGERRDVFAREEIVRIFSAAKSSGCDWYGVCLTARWIGQRYGDVATLTWGSADAAMKQSRLEFGVVDIDTRLIVLDPSKTRRHGTRLVLPISDELAEFLSTRTREDGQFVFPAHAANYVQHIKMRPSFANVLASAGVTDGYKDFHSWRHTFRSDLGAARVGAETANRFGGWTTARMGAHYDHAQHLDEMREAIERIK